MIPHALVRSVLRKLWWQRSDLRREAKRRARVLRGTYRCELCNGLTSRPEIDHVKPVGPTPGSKRAKPEHTWDGFMDRLFNGELQAICSRCHTAKTKATA